MAAITGDLVELMLNQALFEEMQSQPQKARKIYEQITGDIASGYVRAT